MPHALTVWHTTVALPLTLLHAPLHASSPCKSLSLVAAIRQLNDISYTTLIAQGRSESAQSSVVGSHALSRKDLSTGCTLFHSLIVLSHSLCLLHSHCPAVLFFSHFMANKPTTSVVRHLIRFNVGSTSFLAFSYNFPLLFKLHTCAFYDCAGNSLSDCEDAEFIDKNALVWEKCKVLPFLGSWIFPK